MIYIIFFHFYLFSQNKVFTFVYVKNMILFFLKHYKLGQGNINTFAFIQLKNLEDAKFPKIYDNKIKAILLENFPRN